MSSSLVLIEIESPLLGFRLPNGGAVRGAGWILARSPIISMAVYRGPRLLCYATVGLERPDIGGRFPNHPGGGNAGFEFDTGPLTVAPGGDEIELELVARTEDNLESHRFVSGHFVHEEPAVDTALSGPPRMSQDRQDCHIHIDDVRFLGNGLLRISGWVVAESGVDSVDLFLGGQKLAAPEFGLSRPDVGARYPAFRQSDSSGFRLVQEVAAKTLEDTYIRLVAELPGNQHRQLIRPIAGRRSDRQRGGQAADEVRLNCEDAFADGDEFTITGWVVAPGGVSEMSVLFGGVAGGAATIGLSRPDIGNVYPHLAGSRRAGFHVGGKLPAGHESASGCEIVVTDGRGQGRSFHVPLESLLQSGVRAGSAGTDVIGYGSQQDELWLQIDEPHLMADRAADPVSEMLNVGGWAIALSGVKEIRILAGQEVIGACRSGMRRTDVALKFPDLPGSLLSGFGYSVPSRRIGPGEHEITVVVEGNSGATKEQQFHVTIADSGEPEPGRLIRWVPQRDIDSVMAVIRSRQPALPEFLVYLLLPRQASLVEPDLSDSLQAILSQAYRPSRLFLVVRDKRMVPFARKLLAEYETGAIPTEIMVVVKGMISPAPWSLDAADEAGPQRLCVAIVAGTVLGANFLLEMALRQSLDDRPDFIYSDDLAFDPTIDMTRPRYKPDWSPDFLRETNYIGVAWCASPELLQRAGLELSEIATLGQYDAVLRLTGHATQIAHVEQILVSLPRCHDTAEMEVAALQRAGLRHGTMVEVIQACRGVYRSMPVAPASPSVTVIIVSTGRRDLLERCLQSLRANTDYARYDITIVLHADPSARGEHRWIDQQVERVVPVKGKFNWAAFNNAGAKNATSDVLVFLNDDTEFEEPGWLAVLAEEAHRGDIGVVGTRLLYPDGTIQHAGMFFDGTTMRHTLRFAPADEPGPFGIALALRNVLCVTGACLATRRSVFQAAGGFDQSHSIINNDVDYCLRVQSIGFRCVYAPAATVVHHELASRSKLDDVYDRQRFDETWRIALAGGDPYHNSNLRRISESFAEEPERPGFHHSGGALFDAAGVKRILIVKVDHIGDFLIGLPAIRRIREAFPEAKITALVADSVRSLAKEEPSIDEVVVFNFFHAESGKGKLLQDGQRLGNLRAELAKRHFDVAIDLRLHPDTRILLTYTEAAVLVGFQHDGRFPWLTVSLLWEGDPAREPKSSHVSERLLGLADALVRAGTKLNTALQTMADESAAEVLRFGEELPRLRRLLAVTGRFVLIHPGVGTETRQWPARHFALLADMLVAEMDWSVILVGSAGESGIAEEILGLISHKAKVTSAAGVLALAELETLMLEAELFIGNNSGPQHLAASLGVPTVGVYSGVVDVTEWGTLGDRAIAVQRQMYCSPCYLSHRHECPRQMACVEDLHPSSILEASRRVRGPASGRSRLPRSVKCPAT